MKKYLLISLIFSFQLVIFNLKAQVIITQPVVPVANKAVTIFFNASKGTGGLAGYTGTVYAHTGVITNKSLNSTDWKYVNCNDPLAVWGYNKPELQLTHVSGDIWSLELTPNIREFYGVPAEESILQLAFVFRSGEIPVGATSFLEGKDEGWRDIFVDVSESDFNVKIISPVTNSLFVQGQNIPITVACDEMAKIQLAINNIWVDSIATDTLLPHTFQNVQRGFYTLKARASVGSKVQYDSITILVRGTTEVAAVPDGLKDGINYYSNDPTKVTLVLVAPGKDHIFVVGDFNDWQLRLEGQMKRGTRSYQNWKTDFGWGVQPYNYDCYWLTIEGLVPGREYRFQYIVDDSIWTTDPYSELVYDPYNDQYISETTFPNMPTYPNKASIYSLCGTFKTNETQYPWQVNNFVTPNKDKLVIYELLFRDFMSDYGFEQLRDSLDYLQRLGVNAIEFMPMFEFDGNESWGYAPSFYFAPDKNYGTKNNLKKLIDECHRRGIAVILDVVFNHLWGNSPTAQLWWDKAGNQTTDDNPYHFNYVVHPYSVGSDLNHNSPLVNELVKRALKHYLLEYHIDGFRFDLSKGIMGVGYNTGSPCGSDADCGDWVCGEDMGCWNQYNPNRIAILKYYNNYIRSIKSNAFVILEHLAEDQEESDLAGQGMYSWKKVADPFKQLAMGYATGSDIQAAKNKWRVVYMESHDEERLPAEMKKWGNQCFDGCNNGQNYDTRDTLTLPQKMEAVYTLLLTMPGPKMIWQFGELAYDYSIEKCQGEYGMIKPKLDGQGNPVVDTEGRPVYDTFPYHSDCRVDKKPVRWDYFEQPARKVLYEKVSKLNYFHANYPALNNIDPYGADFYIGAKNGDDNSLQKWVYCKKGDDGFIAITNNDIAPQDLYIAQFPNGNGKYYELFSGDSINVVNGDWLFHLEAGEAKVYSRNKVVIPEMTVPAEIYADLVLTVHSDTNIYEIGDSLPFSIATVRSNRIEVYLNDILVKTSTAANLDYTINKLTYNGTNVLMVKAINNAGYEVKSYRFKVNKPELFVEMLPAQDSFTIENQGQSLNIQVLAHINEADNLSLAFDYNDLTTVPGNILNYTINNLTTHGNHIVSVTAYSQYFSSVTTTKHFFVDNKTGILDVDLNQYITVYPNPVQNELKIESEKLKVNSIEMVDINGKMVKNIRYSVFSPQLSVDVSNLKSGQYILKIITEKGVISQKIVK